MHKKPLAIICLSALLITTSSFAYVDPAKYHDFRSKKISTELQRMQDFHLGQAKTKIHSKQLKHAWGDLAYLICQVPNHHLALQQMLNLATQLHKEKEMQEYLAKAVQLYPDDAVVQMFYGTFLYNNGDIENATQHLNLAKKYGDLQINDQLLKNSAIAPQ